MRLASPFQRRYHRGARTLVVTFGVALGGLAIAAATPPTAATPRLRALVVVIDGLRPDHITMERTPALAALAAEGIVSSAHHSVFPTVTRVNASSLATGMLPAEHGILDNVIYLPTVDTARVLSTGDGHAMIHADSVLGGHLLTTPTLHDLLAARGLRTVVASAGSSGSAFLLGGAGRAPILNGEVIVPAALASTVRTRVGAGPLEGTPNLRANAWAVDALLRVGVDSLDADVALLWLSDPDHTAHGAGLGSLLADSAIRAVDREVDRLFAGLTERGLREQVDVFVVSDHGFSTHSGRAAEATRILAPFRDRVLVAGSTVYMRPGHVGTTGQVVRALMASPAIGAIFTRSAHAGDAAGREPGTLSFASVAADHERAGDVLFSANWSHARNSAGIPGWTGQGGVAGHGTSSPYDIGATLVAVGPHIKRGVRSQVPSSNADIAPTILTLLHVPVPRSMSGRPLRELLRDGPDPMRVEVKRKQHHAETVLPGTAPLRYRVTLFTSQVGRSRYVDSTVTTRERVVAPE